MIEVVGVKFKKTGKIQYFLPNCDFIEKGQPVIIETDRGIEYGIVEINNKKIPKSEIENEIRPIIRFATEEDIKKNNENKQKEKDAYGIFMEKMKQHKLKMKLIDVELIFDLNKIIFYFTADGRIDFRELVKDLASIFRMRIELRQIGVRDEARLINGIGICGRTLCCSTFLKDFQPVSIKMAKDQNLSLNPTKISGVCGRLMCCLKYEQDVYEELNEKLPREGDIIKTNSGVGEVLSVNVLRQVIKAAIRKNEQDTPNIEFLNVSEIEIIQRKVIEEEEIDQEELKGIED